MSDSILQMLYSAIHLICSSVCVSCIHLLVVMYYKNKHICILIRQRLQGLHALFIAYIFAPVVSVVKRA